MKTTARILQTTAWFLDNVWMLGGIYAEVREYATGCFGFCALLTFLFSIGKSGCTSGCLSASYKNKGTS